MIIYAIGVLFAIFAISLLNSYGTKDNLPSQKLGILISFPLALLSWLFVLVAVAVLLFAYKKNSYRVDTPSF